MSAPCGGDADSSSCASSNLGREADRCGAGIGRGLGWTPHKVNMLDDELDDHAAHDRETVLLVRNTFLDNASTEGALLADGERAHLLCRRGNRRAATCGASLLATFTPPPSDSDEDEREPEPDLAQSDRVLAHAAPESGDSAPGMSEQRLATAIWLGDEPAVTERSDDGPVGLSLSPVQRDEPDVWGPIRCPKLLSDAPTEAAGLGSLTTGDAASMKITPGEPAMVATRISSAAPPPFLHDIGCTPGPVALPEPRTVELTSQAQQRQYREDRVPVHRGDLDDATIPSVGSSGHHLRDCKPCAFLDSRKGCVRGFQCPYCHLCEPGEKKRRQKEKRKMFTNARKMQQLSEIAQFGG